MAHQGYRNNGLVVESRVLFALGLLFPEFQRAEGWLQEGKAHLAREIERHVYPDGADFELSCGYHTMAARGFLEPLELARLNGIAVPAPFAERLPRTFDYIAGMSRPDGTLPSVNDSGGYRHRSGTEFLEYGSRLFDRLELTAGPEGPFAGGSRVFQDAGVLVMASGHGHRAFWMLMDCGPIGHSHRHEDALNIESLSSTHVLANASGGIVSLL